MNTYITLACLLAVAGVSQGSAIGYGGLGPWGGYGLGPVISSPIVVPAAVSTANQWKAAPIPIIKTIAAPIITAPIIKTVGVSPYGLSPYGLGLGGLGLGGLGVHGMGLNGLGVSGLGVSGLGLKGGYGWH